MSLNTIQGFKRLFSLNILAGSRDIHSMSTAQGEASGVGKKYQQLFCIVHGPR